MADFDVSPDGKLFAFDSRGGAQDDIFIVGNPTARGCGSSPTMRSGTAHPAFSPDGRRLAFHSDRSGRYEIWTIAIDGSGLTQLTKSTGRYHHRAALVAGGPTRRRQLRGRWRRVITLDDKGAIERTQPLPEPAPKTFVYPLAWSADGQAPARLAISRLPDRQTLGAGFLLSRRRHPLSEPDSEHPTSGTARRGGFLGSRAVLSRRRRHPRRRPCHGEAIISSCPIPTSAELQLASRAAARRPAMASAASDNADIWQRTAAGTAAVTLAAGSKLGPYEILGRSAPEGMGEVYRAKDPRLGREVAIKVLPASFSADRRPPAPLRAGGEGGGVLNHPNITAVYDIGRHDGAPYVVQELLEGETLRAALASGELSRPPRRSTTRSRSRRDSPPLTRRASSIGT